jgi:hypothetical protein
MTAVICAAVQWGEMTPIYQDITGAIQDIHDCVVPFTGVLQSADLESHLSTGHRGI